MTQKRALAGLSIAAALVVTRPSWGFEKEWHAGLRAGAASLSGRGWGPAVGLHGAYGISDMFDVTFEGLGSRHETSEADRASAVYSASLGFVYKIDVLEWIPYAGITGGYYHYAGREGPNGESGPRPGAAFQIGLDYLFLRNWAAAAEIRWHTSFTDGLNVPLFSMTLGAEYRWGF